MCPFSLGKGFWYNFNSSSNGSIRKRSCPLGIKELRLKHKVLFSIEYVVTDDGLTDEDPGMKMKITSLISY